jgi:hypothetical protein
MMPQPSLPSAIDLERAGNSTTSDRIRLRSSGSLERAGEFTVYGIVRGRSATYSVDTTDPPVSREVNLTVEEVNTNGDTTRLRVSVRPLAGGRIEHGRMAVSTQKGRVTEQVTPADDGTVVVELNQSTVWSGRLVYEPAAPWWNQSREYPVLATGTRFAHTADLPPIHEIIDFIVITGLVFLPLYLLVYGFDILTNGKLVGWYEP